MKRILLIIGIILGLFVIALGAAPFWLGMQTEAAFEQMIGTMGSRSGMPAKDITFSRGWIRSKADNRFFLPGAPVVISASHRIEHGPLPLSSLLHGHPTLALARIESDLQFSADKDAPVKLAEALKALPLIKLVTTLDLSGDGTSELVIEGGSREAGDERIQWSTANGTIVFARGMKKIKADIKLPSIAIKLESGNIFIKQMTLDSDVYEGTAGYMFGRNTFGISQLSMKPFIDIQGLSFSGTIQPKGKFAAIHISYKLEELKLAKDRYGPGGLNIAIRNLDTATLKKLEDELNSIYGRNLPQEQMQMMVVGKLMEHLGKLTRDNPEIEITKLSFVAPGGELNGKAKFVVEGKDQDLSANPMLVLTAIKGWAEMTMPQSLAKAMVLPQIQRDLMVLQREGKLTREEANRLTPETIDQIAEQAFPRYLRESGFGRWFVLDGNLYKFSLSVSRGQIVVNGVTLTPGAR